MREKKIFIIRHAKAEQHSFFKDDFKRELIQKGIDRAKRIAFTCTQVINISAETIVLSSTANRALQTATLFCETLGFPTDSILKTRALYEANYQDILKEINKVATNIDTVLLFGHNPGLSDLTNYLCNTDIDLNTSAVAMLVIEEGLNFSEVSGNTATLQQIIRE